MTNKLGELTGRKRLGWKRFGTKAYEQLVRPQSSVTLMFRQLHEGDLTCPLADVDDLYRSARFDVDEELLPYIVLAGEISGTVIETNSWDECIERLNLKLDLNDGDHVVFSIPRELIVAARPYDNKKFAHLSDSLTVSCYRPDIHGSDILVIAGEHVARVHIEGLLAYVARRRGWYFYGPAVEELFVGQELTRHALAMYEKFKAYHRDWYIEFLDDEEANDRNSFHEKLTHTARKDYGMSRSGRKFGHPQNDMEVHIGCQTFVGDEIDDAIDALARFLGWMS